MVLLALFCMVASDLQRLQVEPYDFQVDQYYLADIGQLESQNGLLYLRDGTEPQIVVLTPDRKATVIGQAGQGPGELGYTASLAMAVSGDVVWVVDETRRMHRFVAGQFQNTFRLKGYATLRHHQTGGSFPAGSDWVVVPQEHHRGSLALKYDREGRVLQKVGTPLDLDDVAGLERFKDVTLWVASKDRYYALFAYFPVLVEFNKAFEEVGRRSFDLPQVMESFDQMVHEERPENQLPIPLFSSFQIHDGKLYLMRGPFLIELNPRSDATRITGFYGRGPDFADLSPETNFYFQHFAFWNGGLILANAGMARNHDLWLVPDYK